MSRVAASPVQPTAAATRPGRICFVGAGPGAADLLTMRAVRALAAADVVLFDALGCAEALQFCPQAEQIPVGKRAGGTATEQAFINRLLVAQALQGKQVVRLKGGDPTVFGRLDEEIAAAVDAQIAWSVVPGITAASAAAAAAGVTLTQRGVARGVSLLTPAVGRGEAPNPQWLRAAAAGTTIAVYMAGRRRAQTARQLLEAGYAPDTPVVIASGVETADQTLVHSQLGALTTEAANDGADRPCVLLIGAAVRRRLPLAQMPLEAAAEAVARVVSGADRESIAA